MNKRVIMVSVIACMTVSIKTNSATLSQALSAYCVPGNESICTGKERATFTGTSATSDALSKNYCQCGACNMYYDKSSRICKECPVGTYVNDRLSTECIRPSCGAGQYSEVEVGKNECPKGYYKEVFSSCK